MDSEPEPGRDPTDMSPEEVDATLRRMAAVVDICVTQWRAADQEVPEVRDPHNPVLEPGRDARWPDPEYSLVHAQWRQAANRSNGMADMARDFAAWWADAATVAMHAALNRMPVDAVRINAGDPSRSIEGDERDRLAERLAGEGIIHLDLAGPAEPRRHQLWGEVWTEHRVPRLPSWPELLDVLDDAGVRVDRMADVAQGRESIENALAARREALTGQAADEEARFEEAVRLTDLLIEYARRVTAVLPYLRPADGA